MTETKILDFNFKTAHSLIVANFDEIACQKYISDHIKQIDGTTQYVVFKNNKPVIIDKELLRDAYMLKFSSNIQKWNAKRIDMCTVVCKPNQALIVGDEINIFAGFLHIKKPYDTYDNDVKNKVQIMLDFVKDVLCSGDIGQFNYLINWTANVAQGNKNDSVLYFKGDEGIGKSTYTDFLREWVFGYTCTCKGDTDCLLTSYNKMLLGKVLVVFEELPTFSDAQWDGVSSKLKDYVTGKKCNYSDKYEKKIELENLNNYIINTNVHALKHSDGRRYFIVDLCESRKGDHMYFDKLRQNCFNSQVGEAFYNKLLSIDLTGFYSQTFPETLAKKEAKIRSLPTAYQFIKDCYVLKQMVIKLKNTELYAEYEDYVTLNRKSKQHKMDFYKMLEKIGIKSKKSCGFERYNVDVEQLDNIADTNGWLHYTDNIEKPMSITEQLHEKEEELLELQNVIKRLRDKLNNESSNSQFAKDLHDIKSVVDNINKKMNKFPPIYDEIIEKKPTKKVKRKPNNSIVVDEVIEDFLTSS